MSLTPSNRARGIAAATLAGSLALAVSTTAVMPDPPPPARAPAPASEDLPQLGLIVDGDAR